MCDGGRKKNWQAIRERQIRRIRGLSYYITPGLLALYHSTVSMDFRVYRSLQREMDWIYKRMYCQMSSLQWLRTKQVAPRAAMGAYMTLQMRRAELPQRHKSGLWYDTTEVR